MKYLFALILYLFVYQAQAAIYICQDEKQQKSYQDAPCKSETIGQLPHVPDASLEDQLRVQQSIRLANEQYINRMQKLKEEQLAQLEYQRRMLALEVERQKLQALEQEEKVSPQVIVFSRWPHGYGRGHHNYPFKHHEHTHRDEFGMANNKSNSSLFLKGATRQGLSIEYRR